MLCSQSLNDSELAYTYGTLVYAGKPESTPTEQYAQGVEDAVMELLGDYAKHQEIKGRHLFCDRFYSTVELVDRYNSCLHLDLPSFFSL
jgi:hypothetical protein